MPKAVCLWGFSADIRKHPASGTKPHLAGHREPYDRQKAKKLPKDPSP